MANSEELGRALKPKMRRFVVEYLKDGNGTRAAQRAGYSPENDASAAVMANKLLKKPDVIAYREALEREQYQALGISVESLSRKLAEIVERSMEGKEHLSWDSEKHAYVPDGTWVMDAKNAIKAIELLGKSVGMFEERVQLGGAMSVEQYLQQLPPTEEEF